MGLAVKLTLAIAFLLLTSLAGYKATAQDIPYPDSATVLKVGQVTEREITHDADHLYRISLDQNEYVRFNFNAYPNGLAIKLFSPKGNQIQQKWSPTNNAPLSLTFFAEEAGAYEFTVLLGGKDTGTYHLALESPFTAGQAAQERNKLLQVTNWISKDAVPLTSLEPGENTKDLRRLKSSLATSRIVGLGEATHGSREFFQVKHRLLEFLVKEMNFTHFAIEGSQSAARAVNDYVLHGKGSGTAALASMGAWQWNTEEVTALLNWMRSYNQTVAEDKKVQFVGFDFQVNDPAVEELLSFLRKVAPEKAAGAESLLQPLVLPVDPAKPSYVQYYAFSKEKKDSVVQKVSLLNEFVLDNQQSFEQKTSSAEVNAAVQNLLLLNQFAITYNTDGYDIKDPASGLAVRDRYMAENLLKFLSDREDAKIVVWSHNEHIKKDSYNMGYFLSEKLGEAYYAIGLGFVEGSFQAIEITSKGAGPVKEMSVGPPFQNSVDWYMKRTRKGNSFLDFRKAPRSGPFRDWLATALDMRSIGNGFAPSNPSGYYRPPIVLQDCYDGLIYIEKVTRARPNPPLTSN